MITMNRRLLQVVLVAATVLALVACTAGPNDVAHVDAPQIAGFWPGLWHGLISPITFLVSLFNDNVNIYEVHNNGNWYDFGFMLGVSTVFQCILGPSRSARPRRRSRAMQS
jgi:hypothetical protein